MELELINGSKTYSLTKEDLEVAHDAFPLWEPSLGDPVWVKVDGSWLAGFMAGLHKHRARVQTVPDSRSASLTLVRDFGPKDILPRLS